jgi:Ca-activated chloride channel homolog
MRLETWLIAVASMVLPLAAQDPPPTVFRSDSRLVVLHATVLDADGRLVTNLPQSAFHVFENGVEQGIKVFRREDAPVSISLVIDDSGSMTNKRDRVAAAALALLDASHPDDEACVVHFNEKAYLDLDFTHDHKAIGDALVKYDSHGTTAMRDAVRLAIEHMWRKAAEDKKVIILITDGEDNTSLIGQDYIIKDAQQSGVIIYAIGILNEIDDEQTHRAQRDLDGLTQATGGRSYYLKDSSEASQTALDIARNIRNQYTLAYSPPNQVLDGMFRRILVKVTGTTPLTVITRAGYWANGQQTVADR